MSLEEFKKAVLGSISEVKLPENINFENTKSSIWDKLFKKEPLQVVKVSELEQIITDNDLLNRIKEMAKLQPERLGEAVITKQQLADAFNNAQITNPKLLNEAYSEFTGGAYNSEFKFVSNSKIEKLKKEMIEYAETICKRSKRWQSK